MSMRTERGRAAICGQGHVVSPDTKYLEATTFCETCGAEVHTRCPDCEVTIPGLVYTVLPFSGTRKPAGDYRRPGFCGNCGTPFPWIERAELIAELINKLDDEDIAPAKRLEVREELEALADPDLPEEEQKERWEKVRQSVPRVIAGSGRILERIVTEALRQQLGL